MIEASDIEKLATLSRITVHESEREALQDEINAVLSYVSEIEQVQVSAEPVHTHVRKNVLREDGEPHEPGRYSEALLAEAPEKDGDFIRVKKVISHE